MSARGTTRRSDGPAAVADRTIDDLDELYPGLVASSRTIRILWFVAGWVAVGIGSLGVVLPVLPTTPFFIGAAYCFSRSSPRFETWVLGLPGVGPMVRDYRAGFGVPRKVKVVAISMVVVVGSISAVVVSRSRPRLSIVVVVLCLIGVATIVFAVPLRERVLAQRGLTEEDVERARAARMVEESGARAD